MANNNPSYKLTGINPLAYLGVEPYTPPGMILQSRRPTINDANFNIGQFWIWRQENELWVLVNKNDGEPATWLPLQAGGGSGAGEFPTDLGTAIQVGGELNILGGAVVATAGAGNTVRVGLTNGIDGQIIIGGGSDAAWANLTAGPGITITPGPNSLTIESTDGEGIDSIDTNSGSVSPVAGTIEILGDNLINTSGAGNIVTVKLDRSDDGQIPIGATGAPTVMGNITSVDGSVVISNGANTIDLSVTGGGGGGSGGEVITTKFTASGTWTKNANSQNVTVVMWSGGGGGGSGAKNTQSPSQGPAGGGGAAGGGTIIYTAPAANFSATESVVVGAGGVGGVGQSSVGNDGNDGSSGGYSSIGAITTLLPISSTAAAQYGKKGRANGTAGVRGLNITSVSYNIYGPSPTIISGSAGSTSQDLSSGGIGAGGRSAVFNVAETPSSSFSCTPFVTSGGGGGGAGGANSTANVGAAGGDVVAYNLLTTILAGGSSGDTAGPVNGGDGNDALNINGLITGGSGGGGGAGENSTLVNAPGAGGNGGIPGGGGGGGGGGVTQTSGAGGDGARGEVWIIEQLGSSVAGAVADFFLYQSGGTGNLTGSPTMVYLGQYKALTKKYDIGSNVTTGNGAGIAGTAATFTAPVTGEYLLGCQLVVDNQFVSSSVPPTIQIVATNGTYYITGNPSNGTAASPATNGSVLVDMTAGDTATFGFQNGGVNGTRINGTAAPNYTVFIWGYYVG